jgi:hypothetical protein
MQELHTKSKLHSLSTQNRRAYTNFTRTDTNKSSKGVFVPGRIFQAILIYVSMQELHTKSKLLIHKEKKSLNKFVKYEH